MLISCFDITIGTAFAKCRLKVIVICEIKMNNQTRKIVIVALIILGFVGAVLFCPAKMQGGKTCLFHQYISKSEHESHNHDVVANHAHHMERSYLFPFGFLWWLSLAFLVFGIYRVNKLSKI